jgi:hypothetical protein
VFATIIYRFAGMTRLSADLLDISDHWAEAASLDVAGRGWITG